MDSEAILFHFMIAIKFASFMDPDKMTEFLFEILSLQRNESKGFENLPECLGLLFGNNICGGLFECFTSRICEAEITLHLRITINKFSRAKVNIK